MSMQEALLEDERVGQVVTQIDGTILAYSPEAVLLDLDLTEFQERADAIEAERAATLYREQRKFEYDALNQYDLMYQDKVNGTNKWGEAIEAIKAKYPKPTE